MKSMILATILAINAISCALTSDRPASANHEFSDSLGPTGRLAEELSKNPMFLSISGWVFGEPLDLAPSVERHLPANGERSAYFDAHALLSSMLSTLPVDPDESVWCQHPTMVRLIEQVAQGRLERFPKTQCAAFERWANLTSLYGIEILLASPSTHDPVSSFGHTMIRLRYVDHHRPDVDDPVYEIIALTDVRDSTIDYVTRGISGQYPLVFEPKSLRQISMDNRALQARDIVRYGFNLDTIDRRRILERLWELERRAYLPYRFQDQNCSSYLLWFVETALYDRIETGKFPHSVAAPAKILDYLSKIPSPYRVDIDPALGLGFSDPGLVQRLPEVWFAYPHQSRIYEQRREVLASNLGELANAALSDELMETLKVAPSSLWELKEFYLLTLKILRGKVEELERRIQQVEQMRLILNDIPEFMTLDALLQTRRAFYSTEDEPTRMTLIRAHHKRIAAFVDEVPKRPMSHQELAAHQTLKDLRKEFRAAGGNYARLKRETHHLDLSASSTLGELEPLDTMPSHSGYARRQLSMVGLSSDRLYAGVELSFWVWREELGDLRPHGLGPLRSFHLLNLKASIYWSDGQIPQPLLAFRPVGWMAFSPSGWGWGVDFLALWGRSVRSLTGELSAGYLLLDGSVGPWTVGGLVHLTPQLGNDGLHSSRTLLELHHTGDPAIGTSVSNAVSIKMRYRLKKTGSLSLSSRLSRELIQDFGWSNRWEFLAHGTVHWPLTDDESEQVVLRLEHRRADDVRWSAGFGYLF